MKTAKIPGRYEIIIACNVLRLVRDTAAPRGKRVETHFEISPLNPRSQPSSPCV